MPLLAFTWLLTTDEKGDRLFALTLISGRSPLQHMADLNSPVLPAVFTVYLNGDSRRIHAVDWPAHEALGWSRSNNPPQPTIEPKEAIAPVAEVEPASEEEKPTRRKRTTEAEA